MDDATVSRGESYQTFLESTAYLSAGLGLTRDTRATVDQVLDPKTVEVLQKMKKQCVFNELAGCISTGKEANVYFGIVDDVACLAVKVYKTSILGFRDRDEYVDGEYRFRHGYCRSNPRKMVALWAEKELRNLLRLKVAGLFCPTVVKCTRNVLVMSLVGTSTQAAPRLKDVTEEPQIGWSEVYLDVVRSMRRMFQFAKLVHGDLSEYNMLFTKDCELYVIDVSQSVGIDHPRSLEFLKRDCVNINRFFENHLAPISLQDLFHYIVRPSSTPSPVVQEEGSLRLSLDEEETLRNLLSGERIVSDLDDSVFMQTWVPSSLGQVDELHEVERIMNDRNKGITTVYDSLLNTTNSGESQDSEDSEYSSDDDSEDGSEDDSERSIKDDKERTDRRTSRSGANNGHRPENISQEDWKKQVKEEKREQRRNKVPKHLKNKRNLKKYGSK